MSLLRSLSTAATSRLGSQAGDAPKSSKPPRYSAAGLLAKGARNQTWPRVWRDVPLRKSYDVVIIGGGVHGLATA